MSKLQNIISEIETLTVLELAELVSGLQEKFGVSASMAAPAAASAAPAAEAKTSFKVELIDTGSNKMGVIKALRTVKKDLGLMDAKAAAENVPYLLLTDANKEDADNAKKLLEEAGAKVKIS
jgi:large subunit ribosomal protein L7/L12